MSHLANEPEHLELISQFLDSHIDGESFCRDFSALWTSDRDEAAAKHESAWPERYDLKLIESFQENEISPEEFERKWIELHGYGEYRHLLQMVDRIFTACDVFNPAPEREFETDEAQLKSEVRDRLAEYEAERKAPSAQTGLK